MINLACEHCGRTLNIPERYAGVEGACKYCGGRVTVPSPSAAPNLGPAENAAAGQGKPAAASVPVEAFDALRSSVGLLHAQLNESRELIERLDHELQAERAARGEGGGMPDLPKPPPAMSLLPVESLFADEPADEAGLRLAFARVNAQLAQSRREIERMAKDLEALRAEKVKVDVALAAAEDRLRGLQDDLLTRATEHAGAEHAGADADATPEPDTAQNLEADRLAALHASTASSAAGAPSNALSLKWGILLLVVALLVGGTMLFTYYLEPTLGLASRSASVVPAPEPAPEPAPAKVPPAPNSSESETGTLEVSLSFPVPEFREASDHANAGEIPASNAELALAGQHLDRTAFCRMLQETTIPPGRCAPFAEWYFYAAPDLLFEGTGDGLFAEDQQQLAALADRLGSDAYAALLRAAMPFDPPSEWTEHAASPEGLLQVTGLAPGRYALAARPVGPREDWRVETFEPVAGIFVVRPGQTTRGDMQLIDTASVIRGETVDGETGNSVPKASIIIYGEATDGAPVPMTTGDDGAFTVESRQVGYGAFTIRCGSLPKGYVVASTFEGRREPGVRLEPVRIQLKKKAVPPPFKGAAPSAPK